MLPFSGVSAHVPPSCWPNDLGQRCVLHAVGPAPDDSPDGYLGQVLRLHLGQQEHPALVVQLLTRADPADQLGKRVVGGTEVRSVAGFESDPAAELRIDSAQMCRVDRQAAFVRLPRVGQDAE
ncbi:hypothetical protein MLIT_33560 [Mycolicibacterium litorale]|uniref:Uncharacterized protein n=1 Tax=Mycolicibacterium litorale TaxID=758802 RepID=A0AAD1IMB3_9MYCO|nr:hypothetical protein MLIT_33560 [Mycolicibacterium litorale]